MEAKKKWDLLSIASIPLTMTLANSMLIPVLPAMQKALGISPFKASLIITVYAAVAILFIPLAGYLSDRFSRKAVILPGLILVSAAGAGAGLAAVWADHAYGLIITARLIQGLGSAGCFPVVIPLVGDLFKKNEDVSSGLGIVETSNTFGKVLSPILGAALAIWAWYIPFFAIPIFSMLSFGLVLFLVKAPSKEEQQTADTGIRTFLRSIGSILKEKKWLYGIFAMGGICMFVIFGSLFYLSETLETRGMSSIMKGLVLAVPLACLCLASYLSGKWIGENKVVMKWTCFTGLLVAAAGLFILGWVQWSHTWWMVAMLAAASAGIGSALPSLDALITEGIEKEQRGTVTSLYSSMRFIGVAVGPPIIALLMDKSVMLLFMVLASTALVAAFITLIAIRPGEKGQAPGSRGAAGRRRSPAR
ncbi:MFS transporter [Paenibacillus nasutitermitis]|uniref:Bacillibactin exporter n=1 Tax=Paenibacillus nasutitermitis TaxID=1652958 RepID=A0A917E1F9_9BACL|nr:MFS transporter [Paenibacillus nasutitermitis]GGD89467.1 bacillibactin exporter [Paenibacillus nasutitermitis]